MNSRHNTETIIKNGIGQAQLAFYLNDIHSETDQGKNPIEAFSVDILKKPFVGMFTTIALRAAEIVYISFGESLKAAFQGCKQYLDTGDFDGAKEYIRPMLDSA